MASLVDAGAAGASPLHHHPYQNVNVGPSRRPRLHRLHPRVRIAPLFVSSLLYMFLTYSNRHHSDGLAQSHQPASIGPHGGHACPYYHPCMYVLYFICHAGSHICHNSNRFTEFDHAPPNDLTFTGAMLVGPLPPPLHTALAPAVGSTSAFFGAPVPGKCPIQYVHSLF